VSELTSIWPHTVRLEEAARTRLDGPLKYRLVADEGTRAAIAEALDLEALHRLEAVLTVKAWFDGVQIDARWQAEVEQVCGVTLEPFTAPLEGQFTVRVVPSGSPHAPDEQSELALDIEADDPPDVLDAGVVDLGAYVVEHLALEIDPFPRKPDAVFEPPATSEDLSPFAVLRGLKPGGGRT
jgi:uncharacterized metal-binding protein YceD (DUF177 family)